MGNAIAGWLSNRLRETTTYAGLAMVAVGNLQLSSTNQYVDLALKAMPQVGAALVAFDERKRT